MRFFDEVVLDLRAGDGGDGCVAFRREAHVPFGGPAGGDGGRGGSVVIVADAQVGTLIDLYYHPHQRAKNGQAGMGSQKSGKSADDLIIRVPRGTVVKDAASDEVLADLVEDGARFVAAKGGNGGWGNQHFATPTRQAPDFANPGLEGESLRVRLTLKLLADVGLVGLPNAGKSTLISRLSAARPKIAAYPFTTLSPNLGVVRVDDETSLVMADIPGLIEGASEGAGLGHRFLRHIERVGLIAHLVEASPDHLRDPIQDYENIRAELAAYSPQLPEIEEVVVLSKCELDDGDVLADYLREHLAAQDKKLFSVSAVTGAGLNELVTYLSRRVLTRKKQLQRDEDGIKSALHGWPYQSTKDSG